MKRGSLAYSTNRLPAIALVLYCSVWRKNFNIEVTSLCRLFFFWQKTLCYLKTITNLICFVSFQKIRTAYELSNLLMSLYAVVEYEDCLGCEKTNNYLLDSEQKNIDDVVQDKLNTIKRKTKNFLHR